MLQLVICIYNLKRAVVSNLLSTKSHWTIIETLGKITYKMKERLQTLLYKEQINGLS